MTERYCYYLKDGNQEGPVTEGVLREMLQTGALDKETLVWSESLGEWTPASKIPSLQVTATPQPPPVHQPLPLQPESDVSEVVPQVRPWVRLWARMFDYTLFLFFVALMVTTCDRLSANRFFAQSGLLLSVLTYVFFWVLMAFVEAFSLSTWGTTPGKWLLETKVYGSSGNKLAFSAALSRSFLVWVRGIGMGLLPVGFITAMVAYNKLIANGVTTWDRDVGCTVVHRKLKPMKVIGMALFFLIFTFLFMIGSVE